MIFGLTFNFEVSGVEYVNMSDIGSGNANTIHEVHNETACHVLQPFFCSSIYDHLYLLQKTSTELSQEATNNGDPKVPSSPTSANKSSFLPPINKGGLKRVLDSCTFRILYA